ncbi:RNA-directed DNA polymerase, partial [bacterium]|nr:RNA-directed DNA polymerase [bacterium]
YFYSCASIKGKGTGLGIKATKKIMKTKYRYCLKMDIEKFYPNVDKEILKQKFRRVFKDERLLSLLDTIIDGNETQGTGIPIGNYCSQWFANFYLNDLDNFIKHELKIKYYIRYMDDIVVFHTNKRKLRKTKDSIEEYLAKEHLKIKPNWQLFDLNKRFLDFLGFRFYKTHTTLRRNNFLRPKRRAKKIYRKGYINVKDASAMISYNGLIKNSNCHGYLTKYINPYVSINRCKKVVSKNAKGEKNEINKQ